MVNQPQILATASQPGFGDLDGDGDLDAVGTDGAGNVRAWRLRPGFDLSTFNFVTIANVPGATSTRCGDMDGDGMDDVVVQTATETLLVRRIGPFVFGSPEVLYTALDFEPTRRIDLVDLDQDGDLDVILTPFSQALAIGSMALLGDGNGGIGSFAIIFDKVALSQPEAFADLDADGDMDAIGIDLTLGITNTTALVAENLDVQSIGLVACGSAAANSSGLAGRIRAFGTTLAANGPPIRLLADRLPPSSFGIFVGSSELSPSPVAPPGSSGFLCLGGSIGRYSDPGQIGDSGPSGSFGLEIDRSQLRTSNSLVPAVAGQSWFFQAWHRDVVAGAPGSNLTGGVELRFD